MLLGRTAAPDLVLASLRPLPGLALDGDQERYTPQHPADGVVVRKLAGLVHLAEAQGFDRGLDLGPRADRRLHQRCPEGLVSHLCALRALRRTSPSGAYGRHAGAAITTSAGAAPT